MTTGYADKNFSVLRLRTKKKLLISAIFYTYIAFLSKNTSVIIRKK